MVLRARNPQPPRTKSRPGADPDPLDWTIPRTAKYLGCNESTIRKMIADRRLRAYRLDPRVVRLRKSDIDAALERM